MSGVCCPCCCVRRQAQIPILLVTFAQCGTVVFGALAACCFLAVVGDQCGPLTTRSCGLSYEVRSLCRCVFDMFPSYDHIMFFLMSGCLKVSRTSLGTST